MTAVVEPRLGGSENETGSRIVLITDDGKGRGRSGVAAVRALSSVGYHVRVATAARHSLAAASRYPIGVVPTPPADDPSYARVIRDELRRGGYLAALPSSDSALLALVPERAQLLDKTVLANRARAVGILTPSVQEYASSSSLRADAQRLTYPLVVKPRLSRWPAVRVDDARGLGDVPEDEALLVQPYLKATLRAVTGVRWCGGFVGLVHQRYLRTWPVACGTASAAVTVDPDARLEQRLDALLDGYSGIFQAQLAGDYLLDLNLRVYGSLPLAVRAGVNLPALLCDALSGNIAPLRRARPGVFYRWIEGDVRHLFFQIRDGRLPISTAACALLPHRGSAHSVFSWRDVGPAVARFRQIWEVARASR